MQPLILVVPCYNEASRLPQRRFVEALERYGWLRLLFVDDGSTDATASTLRAVQQPQPDRVRILTLERNRGKAAAVRAGLLAAREAKAPFVGYWDADLSAPLDELSGMRELLHEEPAIEAVFGSRVRLLGRQIERSTLRHYLGRVFATAASLSLRLPVYDTQCGAKLLRNSDLLGQVLDRPFDTRWIFDVELLARYVAALGRDAMPQHIVEYPLTQWHAAAGSRLRAAHFVQAAWDLAHIRRQLRRGGGR
jgi:dolichyl-phosphate beta-glucosyltransferase